MHLKISPRSTLSSSLSPLSLLPSLSFFPSLSPSLVLTQMSHPMQVKPATNEPKLTPVGTYIYFTLTTSTAVFGIQLFSPLVLCITEGVRFHLSMLSNDSFLSLDGIDRVRN